MAARSGQPGTAAGAGPPRRSASSDQAAPAGAGSSGTRASSSRTSLWAGVPGVEVIAMSGSAASQASGSVTLVASPTVASSAAATPSACSTSTGPRGGIASSTRRNEIGRNSAAGCPASSRYGPVASRAASTPQSPIRTDASRRAGTGAASQASARRQALARSTGTARGLEDGPDARAHAAARQRLHRAAVAQAAPGRRPDAAAAVGQVGHGRVHAQLGGLLAEAGQRRRPRLADGPLPPRADRGEPLEHLDVALVTGGQPAERERLLAPGGVHGGHLPAGLPGAAGVGEQPPAGQRPRLDADHAAERERGQEHPQVPAHPAGQPAARGGSGRAGGRARTTRRRVVLQAGHASSGSSMGGD